jgi:RHS repeat-associated protein
MRLTYSHFHVPKYCHYSKPVKGLQGSVVSYRFSFNGKENDNEIKGEGNSLDFGARIYDPRLGRFLGLDPLKESYPSESNYLYCSNNPIYYIEKGGEKKITYVEILHKDGSKSIIKIVDESKVKNIRVITTIFGQSTGDYNDIDYDLVQFYKIDENTGKIQGTPEIVTNPTKDILDEAIDGVNKFWDGLKAKEGDNEGGIPMTASSEFNAAETQFFADAKYKELPINVEALMMARGGGELNTTIKLTGMVPEVKELLIKVEKIKGALGGLDVGGGLVDAYNTVKEATKPKLLSKGADSCVYCNKVTEKGKMKVGKEGRHLEKTQTKVTQIQTTTD